MRLPKKHRIQHGCRCISAEAVVRGGGSTCSSEPSFVVVNEMCSLPITISSSCRPTRSGIGQLLSSSFISCAHGEEWGQGDGSQERSELGLDASQGTSSGSNEAECGWVSGRLCMQRMHWQNFSDVGTAPRCLQ